jgi:hypothetical protein
MDNGRQESRAAEIRAGLQGYTGHLKRDELERRLETYSKIIEKEGKKSWGK